MGTGKAAHLVNVIDFGLAKKFRDARTNLHIPFSQDGKHGVGTSLFAAIYTHQGIGAFILFYSSSFTNIDSTECSRRDDLESLSYMLIYFLRGTLPWKKIKASTTSQTWDLIRDKKIETEPFLTAGLPSEFDVLFKYARALEFDDLPDYSGLRAMFRALAERNGIEYDGEFDWMTKKENGKRRFCEACNSKPVS
jgi:casein kinase I family protein HRR25